jgi:hypothetical protein
VFTDIDGWASLLGVVLFGLAIWCFRSDPRDHLHSLSLVLTAPAILIFMTVYATVRTHDAWCFNWAVAGIVVSAPIALIALARLTAYYVAERMKHEQDRQPHQAGG